ncbi:MAG TPA: alanine--tRNA ligase [Dehalococcoidales bacterium]|nr:alanine--tRNA ligase [Dehalococcoidales bacterium]
MKSDELRNLYLKFFQDRGHQLVPSSSLIPHGDPTLLLTSAGMVQFKAFFTGKAIPTNPRATTCQKCFRTNDIESVGDPTHLTFFEMLGNFSFGDYFKKEAITWAWDFVLNYLKIPKERLWVTIYLNDDDAYDLWRAQGVSEDRIVRLGDKDNFWGPAGNSGPCGPCSEIHYDLGVAHGCGKPDCKPGCDCKRFTEIWNLVFTEFNQAEDGTRTKLPKPNIDTGMGFERVLMLMQAKRTPYETDVFENVIRGISELAGKKYGADEVSSHAMRVLADHGRGVTFLLADGVMPGKEGRGYVLRRILRRAEYFGETLAHEKPFLVTVAEEVIKKMGHVYPELVTNRKHILAVIESEVDNFRKTLPVGRGILLDTFITMRQELKKSFANFETDIQEALRKKDAATIKEHVAKATDSFIRQCPGWEKTLAIGGRDACAEVLNPLKQKLHEFSKAIKTENISKNYEAFKAEFEKTVNIISGYEAFVLHDTFGFPIDLTREISKNRGFAVDMAGFESEMEKQRERAKASHKFTNAVGEVELDAASTEFIGYEHSHSDSKIVAIIIDGDSVGVTQEEQEAGIILETTPFYGEMGGQVGDTGIIENNGNKFIVTDTVKIQDGKYILHRGKQLKGSLAVDDKVHAEIDMARRMDIARNHTATHLLQNALRKVVGTQVQQRGSLVTPERLRFDFSQLVALSPEQIQQVQQIVNERIREDHEVWGEVIPYPKAIAEGAIALFDEKYGDNVRALRVGKPVVSIELCGGTHVHATGQIGACIIVSESSIGSGLRRIEAVTGRGAEQYIEKLAAERKEIARTIGAAGDEVVEKVKSVLHDFDQEKKLRQIAEKELAHNLTNALLNSAEIIKGINVVAAQVPSLPSQALREMGDILREKLKSAVIVLGTIYEDRPSFLAIVTQDLVSKGYNAGNIVKKVAEVTGGGGGGKPTMAQAGGKDKTKVAEAIKLVRSLI